MTETTAPVAPVTSPAASVAAATSQATLDALLCDILPRQGCWSDEAYLWLTEHGTHARGGTAASSLLEGFAADVAAVFDAPESGT